MAATRSIGPIWLLLLAPSLACGGAAANDARRGPAPVSSLTPDQARPRTASRSPAPENDSAASHGDLQALHDEIQTLDGEIRVWSRELALAPGSPCGRDAPLVPCLPREPDSPGAPESDQRSACRDVCETGERICENAEEICERAQRAGESSWAEEKCDAAKDSCRAATRRCDDCGQNGNKGSPPFIL